jgi:L,D-peptidoglycan transpeptidase YkuD (ErfK/YbiS/YcfS/YnhG family)
VADLAMRVCAALAAAAAWVLPALAGQPPCPSRLSEAIRLVLISTPTMDDAAATLETFERDSPEAPWRHRSGPEPAVVGEAGLGWGFTFRGKAQPGEPLKMEGDKRAPAGIFAIGAPFGFAATDRPGYMQLKEGVQICVDDPASPDYSQIVARAEAGPEARGEEMATIPVYERGLVVDYPTSREEKAGSCIFSHSWRGEGLGTSGCIAAPESTVASLQDVARAGKTVIAILPQSAQGRFPGCLP